MALRVPVQPVVGTRFGVRAGGGSDSPSSWGDGHGSTFSSEGTTVCLQSPLLKSRLSSSRPQESLQSSLSSSYQAVQPIVNQSHGSSTTQRNGVFINQLAPNKNSAALIDIEDAGDGAVTFKYGALEDLWDLDRLLEHLCRGAFNSHTVESFVPVVVDLFRFPVSAAGQRKLVELVCSYIRLHRDVSPAEAEKMVSQILAEASSEFLPPPSVGNYSRGSSRPFKRFSSSLDKWWRKLDSYLGVGDDGMDVLSDDSFQELDSYPMQPLRKYEKLNSTKIYETLEPAFSRAISRNLNHIAWKGDSGRTSWSGPLPLESPKTSTLEFVRENESSAVGSYELVEGDYTAGLGFILISSQLNTLEDVLRKTAEEERNRAGQVVITSSSCGTETLPISSIAAMVQWEREDAYAVSLSSPSGKGSRPKLDAGRTTQRSTTKTKQRVRGGRGSSTKTAPKTAPRKRSTVERRKDYKLCDMFFGLPLSHKHSGVASFLVMRKDFSEEILIVLNQVAVGLAGAGLAVSLHVGARMLSVNSIFDSSKLFGLIRGASLLWLSAAMQGLRGVMLRLPAGCTIAGFDDKEELLRLQQRLRSLSFRALTVMVLTVVGHGF